MYVGFETLPLNSKIWVYQANRPLTSQEIAQISEYLSPNLDNWASHGNPLKSSFKFYHERFLIIAVDPSFQDTSGCSIDTSTRWIKQILEDYQIDFLNRDQCYFKGNSIESFSIFQGKKQVESGQITKENLIFNNAINTIADLEKNWIIKAENSHLARFFD